MNIETNIAVMNNVDAGQDFIWVSTTCQGSITLHIPIDKDTIKVIELSRVELTEFLARTSPDYFVKYK